MFELKKGLINPEDFKDFKCSNAPVDYDLYCEKDQEVDTLTAKDKIKLHAAMENRKAACFYSMHSAIAASEHKYDRVRVIFKRSGDLNKDKAVLWLNLCKEHSFLPDYVPTEEVVNMGYACIALDQHTYNQVYVYLTVIRFLQDEPGHVGAALKFMELGMKFIPAMFAAAKVSVGNSNHHFLSGRHCTGHFYYEINKLTSEKIYVEGMVGLHRFIHQHKKYNCPRNDGSHFSCNVSIEKACQVKDMTLSIEMLFHPGIELLFLAETDKELKTILSMLHKTTTKNKKEAK